MAEGMYWMPTDGDRVYCVIPKALGTLHRVSVLPAQEGDQYRGTPVSAGDVFWQVQYDKPSAGRSMPFQWCGQASTLILPERPAPATC